MAEYTEREAVIAMCKENADSEWNKCAQPTSWADAYQEFADDIENFPAADVVEVPTDATDDLNRAVIGLGIFRLSFCLNVEKTDSENDLVFRCEECPFEDKETRKCSVKVFLNRYATKEDKQRFSPVV